MAKFSVGNQAKCVDGDGTDAKLITGKEYVISCVDVLSSGDEYVGVGKSTEAGWSASRFEPIADIGPQSSTPSSVAHIEASDRYVVDDLIVKDTEANEWTGKFGSYTCACDAALALNCGADRSAWEWSDSTQDFGTQSAAPSSVARVEAQARDAAQQLQQFDTGAVRGTDANGARFDLISPHLLQSLAETYAEGSAKYGDDNWLKGIPSKDLLNHALRHLNLWQLGDSSEPHLAHAIWNLGAIIHFEKTRPELVVRQYAEGVKP